MGYVIDKLSDLEIIKVTVSGTLNQDTREEILLKALSGLDTNGYHKLLIDVVGREISENYMTRTSNMYNMVDSIKKSKRRIIQK